jgi:hypothetical protein
MTHTGDNISELTKVGLISIGVGDDDTPVQECFHVCTPDKGARSVYLYHTTELFRYKF